MKRLKQMEEEELSSKSSTSNEEVEELEENNSQNFESFVKEIVKLAERLEVDALVLLIYLPPEQEFKSFLDEAFELREKNNTDIWALLQKIHEKYPENFIENFKLSNVYLRTIRDLAIKGDVSCLRYIEKAAQTSPMFQDLLNKMYFKIGINYHHGLGFEKNIEKAIHYYEKCYKKGDETEKGDAAFRLVVIYFGKKNYKESLPYLEFCSRSSNDPDVKTISQYLLYHIYSKVEVAPKDDKEALKYLKMAAESGHPDAMFLLSEKYLRRFFFKKRKREDFLSAINLLFKAADSDHLGAKQVINIIVQMHHQERQEEQIIRLNNDEGYFSADSGDEGLGKINHIFRSHDHLYGGSKLEDALYVSSSSKGRSKTATSSSSQGDHVIAHVLLINLINGLNRENIKSFPDKFYEIFVALFPDKEGDLKSVRDELTEEYEKERIKRKKSTAKLQVEESILSGIKQAFKSGEINLLKGKIEDLFNQYVKDLNNTPGLAFDKLRVEKSPITSKRIKKDGREDAAIKRIIELDLLLDGRKEVSDEYLQEDENSDGDRKFSRGAILKNLFFDKEEEVKNYQSESKKKRAELKGKINDFLQDPEKASDFLLGKIGEYIFDLFDYERTGKVGDHIEKKGNKNPTILYQKPFDDEETLYKSLSLLVTIIFNSFKNLNKFSKAGKEKIYNGILNRVLNELDWQNHEVDVGRERKKLNLKILKEKISQYAIITFDAPKRPAMGNIHHRFHRILELGTTPYPESLKQNKPEEEEEFEPSKTPFQSVIEVKSTTSSPTLNFATKTSNLTHQNIDQNLYETGQVKAALLKLRFQENCIISNVDIENYPDSEISSTKTLQTALDQCVAMENGQKKIVIFKVSANERNFSEQQNENNHYVGLHIKKENNQFIVRYIDPTGREIHTNVKRVIDEWLSNCQITSSNHKLQSYDDISVKGTNCGPFLAYLLGEYETNPGLPIILLTEEKSQELGNTLRQEFHTETFERHSSTTSSSIQISSEDIKITRKGETSLGIGNNSGAVNPTEEQKKSILIEARKSFEFTYQGTSYKCVNLDDSNQFNIQQYNDDSHSVLLEIDSSLKSLLKTALQSHPDLKISAPKFPGTGNILGNKSNSKTKEEIGRPRSTSLQHPESQGVLIRKCSEHSLSD